MPTLPTIMHYALYVIQTGDPGTTKDADSNVTTPEILIDKVFDILQESVFDVLKVCMRYEISLRFENKVSATSGM